MATTITIPGGAGGQRIADAFAGLYGYQAQVPDPNNPGQMIANPVTQAQFVKQKIVDHVKEVVAAWEGNQAGDTARNAAIQKAQTEVTVT